VAGGMSVREQLLIAGINQASHIFSPEITESSLEDVVVSEEFWEMSLANFVLNLL
jgi:hypothetical protein